MRNAWTSLLSVLLLSACSQISEEFYTTRTFEPTENVDILNAWPTNRKYAVIAKLEVRADKDAINELLNRAKEIGADAIVLGPVHRHGQMWIPLADGYQNPAPPVKVQLNSIQTIAIKYIP